MLTSGLTICRLCLGKRDTDVKITAERSADPQCTSEKECGWTCGGGDGTRHRWKMTTGRRDEERSERWGMRRGEDEGKMNGASRMKEQAGQRLGRFHQQTSDKYELCSPVD